MTKYFSFLLLLLSSLQANAQRDNEVPLDNSPFSRFGLGDYMNQNFAASSAFGGLSATYNDPYHLNVLNPAASSQLKSTAYEIGIYGKYSTLKDSRKSLNLWSGHLNYLALGFPLRNQINELLDRRQKSNIRHGMHIALLPYTTVGYNIRAIGKIPQVDSVIYDYSGKGGTYKFMWGNSIAYKNFSAGINLGYFFGTVRNQRQVALYNILNDYNDDLRYTTTYNGFVWNIGTQYTYDIMKKVGKKSEKSGKRIIIGAYGNSANKFSSVSNQTIRRINSTYGTIRSFGVIDTLFKERQQGVEGKGKLPAEFALGLTYEKENKLRLGVNFSSGLWSQYENSTQPDKLANTYAVSAGVEYTPEYNSYNKYVRKIRYRLGVHHATDPRVVKGEQITTTGLSFGFGLPLVMPRQQISFVDLTFDLGKSGMSLLNENYFKMTAGFTLNDNSWFYKRRFN
jgi:hypothetical protein